MRCCCMIHERCFGNCMSVGKDLRDAGGMSPNDYLNQKMADGTNKYGIKHQGLLRIPTVMNDNGGQNNYSITVNGRTVRNFLLNPNTDTGYRGTSRFSLSSVVDGSMIQIFWSSIAHKYLWLTDIILSYFNWNVE